MQKAGFELIYSDTDAVFLKRKDATRRDFKKIMEKLIRETGLEMTLEFHYKFLVLLYMDLIKRRIIIGTTKLISSVREMLSQQKWSYRMSVTMTLFSDQDVLTRSDSKAN